MKNKITQFFYIAECFWCSITFFTVDAPEKVFCIFEIRYYFYISTQICHVMVSVKNLSSVMRIGILSLLLAVVSCADENEADVFDAVNEDVAASYSDNISLDQIECRGSEILNIVFGEGLSRSDQTEPATVSAVKSLNGQYAYLIKKSKKSGFVLMSSNRNFEPILAYSESGNFPDDYSRNESFMFWLNQTLQLRD